MANDRSKIYFNILVALTREIGDGPCFLYLKFSWIGVFVLINGKQGRLTSFSGQSKKGTDVFHQF